MRTNWSEASPRMAMQSQHLSCASPGPALIVPKMSSSLRDERICSQLLKTGWRGAQAAPKRPGAFFLVFPPQTTAESYRRSDLRARCRPKTCNQIRKLYKPLSSPQAAGAAPRCGLGEVDTNKSLSTPPAACAAPRCGLEDGEVCGWPLKWKHC